MGFALRHARRHHPDISRQVLNQILHAAHQHGDDIDRTALEWLAPRKGLEFLRQGDARWAVRVISSIMPAGTPSGWTCSFSSERLPVTAVKMLFSSCATPRPTPRFEVSEIGVLRN